MVRTFVLRLLARDSAAPAGAERAA
jgi:hypothetical protein